MSCQAHDPLEHTFGADQELRCLLRGNDPLLRKHTMQQRCWGLEGPSTTVNAFEPVSSQRPALRSLAPCCPQKCSPWRPCTGEMYFLRSVSYACCDTLLWQRSNSRTRRRSSIFFTSCKPNDISLCSLSNHRGSRSKARWQPQRRYCGHNWGDVLPPLAQALRTLQEAVRCTPLLQQGAAVTAGAGATYSTTGEGAAVITGAGAMYFSSGAASLPPGERLIFT